MNQYQKIKDMPISDRPYEKMERLGPHVLSNSELLAIIIKTGYKNKTSVDLARTILNKGDGNDSLLYLKDVSLEQLMTIKGIGKVKAIQLKALVELAIRISQESNSKSVNSVSSPEDVAKYLMERMRYYKKEHFMILLLNTKNGIIKEVEISKGTIDMTLVHPRDVFYEAVACMSKAIILLHNHPSGDVNPSKNDLDNTNRILEAGKILGIKVLDHIIIGDGKIYSFKEHGKM